MDNKDSDSTKAAADGSLAPMPLTDTARESIVQGFVSERYKFVLQQIHVVNENLYRFLAIYQAIVTALVGAQLVLFVNYHRWGIPASRAKTALIGLVLLESAVGAFVVLLIVVGVLTWLDYRNEECDLSDWIVGQAFRSRPNASNWFRWYETYVGAFVIVSIALAWLLTLVVMFPAVR